MPRIDKLTPEQAALLPVKRDEWISHGLSTEPANRADAERGVRLAYEAAGLPHPQFFIWVDSPYAGAFAQALAPSIIANALTAAVGDQVGDQVWDQVGAQVGAQVRDQVWDQVRAQVGAQVRAQVRAQVGDQVCTPVTANMTRVGWRSTSFSSASAVWSAVKNCAECRLRRSTAAGGGRLQTPSSSPSGLAR